LLQTGLFNWHFAGNLPRSSSGCDFEGSGRQVIDHDH